MKQDEGKTNEVEANPYNRKKYWHTDDVMPKTLVSADSGPAEPDPDKKTGFDYATNTTTDSITQMSYLLLKQPLRIRSKIHH